MKKEDMDKELIAQLEFLNVHAFRIKCLISDLNVVTRPMGDVLFSAIDKSKQVLGEVTELRASVQKVRTTLKARAKTIMKDC